MDAIAEAEQAKIDDKTRREAVRRESEYFKSHKDYMNYRTTRKEDVLSGNALVQYVRALAQSRASGYHNLTCCKTCFCASGEVSIVHYVAMKARFRVFANLA